MEAIDLVVAAAAAALEVGLLRFLVALTAARAFAAVGGTGAVECSDSLIGFFFFFFFFFFLSAF